MNKVLLISKETLKICGKKNCCWTKIPCLRFRALFPVFAIIKSPRTGLQVYESGENVFFDRFSHIFPSLWHILSLPL